MQISKFFLRVAFSVSLVLWANTGLFAQDSGPNPLLARSGFVTESYNLRFSTTSTLTSASASYQITQPMSQFVLYSDVVASFAFSTTAVPTATSKWEALPAAFKLEQSYEAASGSYIFIRAGAGATRFHFYSIGRQRY